MTFGKIRDGQGQSWWRGALSRGNGRGEVLCMFEEKQESQRIWTTVSKGVE